MAVLGRLYTMRTNGLIFGAEPFQPKGIRILGLSLGFFVLITLGMPFIAGAIIRLGPKSGIHLPIEWGWRLESVAVEACLFPIVYLLVLSTKKARVFSK